MSPLKLALLLRAYSMPRPNMGLPAEQAYAPAMVQAVNEFRDRGIFQRVVSVSTLRLGYATGGGSFAYLLTAKGEELVKRILEVTEDCYRETGT